MKTLIWDFDETLGYREGGRWTGALLEVIRQDAPGADVTAEAIKPYLQTGFPWHMPDRPHPELCSADRWWAAQSPLFERAFRGVGFDPSQARQMAGHVRTVYVNPERWRLYEDTLPTLALLLSQGWTHVLLSNHVPELRDILRHLELDTYLARVFNSAETGYEKPHLQAFRMVLDAYADAAAIWMIGDNPHADIAGAASAGIPGILVRKSHADARYCCPELSQVPALIEREFNAKAQKRKA